ncbi:MAG: VWA domain-containing protein, partial [Verrucomicrobia bacterium]|nr:VWA domain-containing protein [Verrucomicrobiota bacterium]
MDFVHPKLLLLIWLVPLMAIWWVWSHKRQQQALDRFVAATMRHKLWPSKSALAMRVQIVAACLATAFAIVALARPQWGEREEVVYQHGRDLIIALDVSRSMLADDVRPNRLQRAKTDLLDLIRELRGDRAGLIAFRKQAINICPLTTDYAYLKQALDATGIDSAPRGETDIGNAIRVALDAFDTDSGGHRAIVLISDGEDLKGNAIEAAQEAAGKGVTIFTVGLGSRHGSTIPDQVEASAHALYQNKAIVTKLDNDMLNAIAETTGGAYIPLETASTASTTLGTLYRDHLRNIAARDIEESLQRRRVDRFQWFLFPATLCWFVVLGFSRGRLARMSRPQVAVAEPPLVNLDPPKRELRQLVLFLATLLTTMSAWGDGNADTNAIQASLDIPAGRLGA